MMALLLIVTVSKPVQPEKALAAMLVMRLGMVTAVNPVQPSKALAAMVFTA